MENIICKACSASIEKDLEFCSSCGEWLGLKVEEIESNETNETTPLVRNRVPQIKCSSCNAATYHLLKTAKSVVIH